MNFYNHDDYAYDENFDVVYIGNNNDVECISYFQNEAYVFQPLQIENDILNAPPFLRDFLNAVDEGYESLEDN